MDLATILGLVLGFAFVIGAIVKGGDVMSFLDIPSVLIVICGTFSITMVCFKLKEVVSGQKLWIKSLLFKVPDPAEEGKKMIALAQKARANGLLAIQSDVEQIPDTFLKQGFTLAVDGTNPEVIERIMKADAAMMADRHAKNVMIMKKSAELAPAMGLIGTLIGLVIMLQNLDDPSSIGPAMAVALLTTMYGAVLANMVFTPVATKLDRNSAEESTLRRVYILSVLSVVRQENPRQLEMLINTILPPAKRISVFD